MRYFYGFLTALLLSSNASANDAPDLPSQAAMENMHGDCTAFSWDMSSEFSTWSQSALPVDAATSADDAVLLPLNTPVELTLAPHAAVTFAVPPEKDRSEANTWSGLVRISPKRGGIYRVSASSGVWIDAVSNGELVPSVRFEMQTGCKPDANKYSRASPTNSKRATQSGFNSTAAKLHKCGCWLPSGPLRGNPPCSAHACTISGRSDRQQNCAPTPRRIALPRGS